MKKKINIAELLKDCPQGMELDCTLYDNCTFEGIEDVGYIYILLKNPSGIIRLTKEGCYIRHDDYAKCVIFPKGKTTWEGFVPPCKFKDGDIIFTHANCLEFGVGNTWISIYQENRNGGVATYVDCAEDGSDYYSNIDGDKAFLCFEKDILRQRLATEEEKQKLFDTIKEHGYKWNAETKTLEKLIQPKFKVGDKVIRTATHEAHIIEYVTSTGYLFKNEGGIGFIFEDENLYELVPNKFDITTLKTFDKVLVRDRDTDTWEAHIFSRYYRNSDRPYICIGCEVINEYKQCIPYDSNKELLCTTNDCDDFYKTW